MDSTEVQNPTGRCAITTCIYTQAPGTYKYSDGMHENGMQPRLHRDALLGAGTP